MGAPVIICTHIHERSAGQAESSVFFALRKIDEAVILDRRKPDANVGISLLVSPFNE